MDGDAANTAPLSHSADEGDAAATCSSGSSLVVEGCVDTRRGRWTARATMVGELAVDARQFPVSNEQCLFVLERSGELIGVASLVGFFAGEAILCRLELGIECVKEVVEPLEVPDAVGRYLGHLERAGSRVLQRIASLGAAQAQTDCAAGRRPHRNLETAVGGDRHGWAGAGCLAGGECLVDAAVDDGR